MATGTRLIQEISDQFLNCKICFTNFRDPKTLSCLHTFCCSCLQQQYDQEVSSRVTRYTISIYNRQVTCPLCRKKTDLPAGGVKRLPDNFLVSNLTEVLAKRTISKVPPCEICSSVRSKNVDASNKCLDCTKLLCKACVDLHLSTKVTQHHSLIDLEGEKDIQCKIHTEEIVRFYCEPCDECICVVCAFQVHRDHDVCSFSDGSAKNRSSLEALLGRCKERVSDVSVRLHAIDKYETVMKDVKERIRDLAISYIAQVRAKEKELMKRIEDEYGGEIKDFVDHKQILQENLDELQSTCNLTDIMLKDKGVELLLIKKEIEGKMTQLLEPGLPEMPSEPKYDVRFVPGDVALGCLSFGDKEIQENDTEDEIHFKKSKLQESMAINGNLSLSEIIEPDVITNTMQIPPGKTKEVSTSMRADMRTVFCNTNSQTEVKSLTTRDTSTNIVETRERGVFAKVSDVKARGTMTERSDVRSLKCQTEHAESNKTSGNTINDDSRNSQQLQSTLPPQGSKLTTSSVRQGYSGTNKANEVTGSAGLVECETKTKSDTVVDSCGTDSLDNYRSAPDLLPTSASFTYSPRRFIRSIRVQTDESRLENAEPSAASANKQPESPSVASPLPSRVRDRPRRVRTVETGVMTIHPVRVIPDVSDSATSPGNIQLRDAGVYACSDLSSKNTQTSSVQRDDSGISTDRKKQLVRSTSTQAINTSDKDTSTPIVTSESKAVWTEALPTSDRATSTVATKTQERCTGTIPIKTGDIGVQIKPYSIAVSTNTSATSSSDHESQTFVETTDQGTLPDSEIEARYLKIPKVEETMDSSVDFVTPPQSPGKAAVKSVDKATDPVKVPCFTKSTETVKISTMTSSTETPLVKFSDKDTITSLIKTIDQWTETPQPQLISTGVTPPTPATLDVGVATNVTLTDDQATCTDVKAFRDSHTETIVVVCDNETLTEAVKQADAQTSVEIHRDNQECETDKTENIDKGSMTDFPGEGAQTDALYKQPSLQNKETNTSRNRRKSKEIQTVFTPTSCSSCGLTNPNTGQNNNDTPTSSGNKPSLADQPGSLSKEFKDSSTMPKPLDTQEVGTMAISCVTCQHDFHETAIQTSQPKLYDRSSATSFELDLDFLERALNREHQDAATSTESLPYIGLLSEIDVDELIVLPEANFELVSDTDSEFDLIMVDDETSTDLLQSVEAGTQTVVIGDDLAGSPSASMTESTGSRGVGEVIKSIVQSQGFKPGALSDSPEGKNFASIGINTVPNVTLEKETCTPIRHLFSKGVMTFFVSKMDKSTSTFNQARIITGSTLPKAKSEDKITMTPKPEKRDVGVETETIAMDGKITKCISKLRSVSEKLNSPPAKKSTDHDTFFGTNFNASRSKGDVNEKTSFSMSTSGASNSDNKPEEERQRQLKTLLEQTNALLKSKDRSTVRKPQPITTLKGRQSVTLESGPASPFVPGTVPCVNSNLLTPDAAVYESKSLPRGSSHERSGTVRMGSQPLSPSRLPLLRYNSAPGRIATVPTQTLLMKSCHNTPILGRCPSPRLSPSKIPITKKPSPPEYQIKQQQQQQQQQQMDSKSEELGSIVPPLRRPLPSITETRTPSSCSDSSTTSYISAESIGSAAPSSVRLSTDSSSVPSSALTTRISSGSTTPTATSKRVSVDSCSSTPTSPSNPHSTDSTSTPNPNRLSVESVTTPPSLSDKRSGDSTTTPSRSPSATTSLSSASASLTDSVFKKSSSDVSRSLGSSETLDEKKPQDDKSTAATPTKKSGMGFMQRLLSRKKKPQETKKEPVSVVKAGPTTAAAVAALASAVPPLPAPAPESYAISHVQHPPHHYPPLPAPAPESYAISHVQHPPHHYAPPPAPTPESHAISHIQHPPHHYPPLPEPTSPPGPRKSQPFVYVQQRIVSIQQDNVEEISDKNPKQEDKKLEQASSKNATKERDTSEKQKEKSAKDSQGEKEKKKKKKDDKEKEKSKVKVAKTKTKKSEDKNKASQSSLNDEPTGARNET